MATAKLCVRYGAAVDKAVGPTDAVGKAAGPTDAVGGAAGSTDAVGRVTDPSDRRDQQLQNQGQTRKLEKPGQKSIYLIRAIEVKCKNREYKHLITFKQSELYSFSLKNLDILKTIFSDSNTLISCAC